MISPKNILVTGAAGFIGSCFAIQEVRKGNNVIGLDICSYAANIKNLDNIIEAENFTFIKGDILDEALIAELLKTHSINAVVHFAAESHVDNSIASPAVFFETNVLGTFYLINETKKYWEENGSPSNFRFIHVSTDEVFGELDLNSDEKFSETTSYTPNSPYSASKAGSDHIARSWFHTYKLPVIVTNCSNNYGPRQHAEKLIPHMISCALQEKPLPIYGTGENVRDWIYVDDHTRGVSLALEKGVTGESYCLGGNQEMTNIDLVKTLCKVLDDLRPRENGAPYADLITFVEDRKGHDLRYAIDDSKAKSDLGYVAQGSFKENLTSTIKWYLDHADRLA